MKYINAVSLVIGCLAAFSIHSYWHEGTQDARISALQNTASTQQAEINKLSTQVRVLEHPQASTTSADNPAQVVHAYGNGVGQMDMGSRTCNIHNCGGIPWAATDYTGAYEVWVENGNLYVLSDGDKMIGGSICLTYNFTAVPVCLNNTGTLTLRTIGPNGPYGPSETLTPALIEKLKELK
jgi:hypothetical protein